MHSELHLQRRAIAASVREIRQTMNLPSASSPESSSISPERDSKAKVWHVGTLTYTTAGLVLLFAWLLWGDFAWAMKDRSVLPVVQLLMKKYSASDLLMGILLASLPAGIGLFLGPI